MRLAALGLAVLLAGCGGIPAYKENGPAPLEIQTKLDSGGRFMRIQAALDVHRVGRTCETEHLGRVNLDDPAMRIGIPEERIFLDFIFVSGGMFSGTGATRYSTVLTPRRGYEYRAEVSYDKGMYDVVIREGRKGSAQGRVIDSVPLSACEPS